LGYVRDPAVVSPIRRRAGQAGQGRGGVGATARRSNSGSGRGGRAAGDDADAAAVGLEPQAEAVSHDRRSGDFGNLGAK